MKKKIFANILMISMLFAGCANPVSNTDSILSQDTEQIDTTISDTQTIDMENATEQTPYGISITELTEDTTYYSKTDPSVQVLNGSASYPEISISDHADIEKKINDVIKSEVDTFWTFEEENSGYADSEYQMTVDNADTEFEPYTAEFSYETKRCDDAILSIVFKQYDYSYGAAHGNLWSYGITFDVNTGERLYLETLSDDYTSFYQMLVKNLNDQAVLPAYENFVFSDFASDIESSLLKDSASWYFDRSGLSFISNPYVLGSYAAGTFEFNIPYDQLTGLKSAYAYKGPYICKLFPGISVSHDVNGNGSADEICYSLNVGDNMDYSSASAVLTINGTDFSRQLDDLHLTYPWTGAYYLIDVDSEDSYVEIAISNENYDNPKGTCTHFFRYDTSGELIYQGNVAGIFNEDMQVRYNSNGNLILCDRNGEPVQ